MNFIPESVLTVVAVNTPEGDRFKLVCPNCRYSTTSAGMPEFETVTEFKLPSISACDYFEDIYKHFEDIASYEKEEQESLKYPPRKRFVLLYNEDCIYSL